jgi:hypothetical protein
VAPLGSDGSTWADVSTTAEAAVTVKLCSTILPSFWAVTLKACIPAWSWLGVQATFPPSSMVAPLGPAASANWAAPGDERTAW